MFITIQENGRKYYIESENKEIFSIAIIYRITIARNTFENSIL